MNATTERPLVFDCEGEALVGVLGLPATTASDTGVLIVVGGPQVRSGSHRQFVLLARRLAAAGFASLRFDVRGMGDSEGAARDFTGIEADIGAAIDALLQACPQLRQLVLWGLCDGASASLMYWAARRDPRVQAMCLLNPWLRSEAGQARTQVRHYYVQRLLQPAFWRKLVGGGVGPSALAGLVKAVRRSGGGGPADVDRGGDFRKTMARAWTDFGGPMLLLLSGKDYTAKEFLDGVASDPAWRGALQRPGLRRIDLPDADHTFSAATDRLASEQALVGWLHEVSA